MLPRALFRLKPEEDFPSEITFLLISLDKAICDKCLRVNLSLIKKIINGVCEDMQLSLIYLPSIDEL